METHSKPRIICGYCACCTTQQEYNIPRKKSKHRLNMQRKEETKYFSERSHILELLKPIPLKQRLFHESHVTTDRAVKKVKHLQKLKKHLFVDLHVRVRYLPGDAKNPQICQKHLQYISRCESLSSWRRLKERQTKSFCLINNTVVQGNISTTYHRTKSLETTYKGHLRNGPENAWGKFQQSLVGNVSRDCFVGRRKLPGKEMCPERRRRSQIAHLGSFSYSQARCSVGESNTCRSPLHDVNLLNYSRNASFDLLKGNKETLSLPVFNENITDFLSAFQKSTIEQATFIPSHNIAHSSLCLHRKNTPQAIFEPFGVQTNEFHFVQSSQIVRTVSNTKLLPKVSFSVDESCFLFQCSIKEFLEESSQISMRLSQQTNIGDNIPFERNVMNFLSFSVSSEEVLKVLNTIYSLRVSETTALSPREYQPFSLMQFDRAICSRKHWTTAVSVFTDHPFKITGMKSSSQNTQVIFDTFIVEFLESKLTGQERDVHTIFMRILKGCVDFPLRRSRSSSKEIKPHFLGCGISLYNVIVITEGDPSILLDGENKFWFCSNETRRGDSINNFRADQQMAVCKQRASYFFNDVLKEEAFVNKGVIQIVPLSTINRMHARDYSGCKRESDWNFTTPLLLLSGSRARPQTIASLRVILKRTANLGAYLIPDNLSIEILENASSMQGKGLITLKYDKEQSNTVLNKWHSECLFNLLASNNVGWSIPSFYRSTLGGIMVNSRESSPSIGHSAGSWGGKPLHLRRINRFARKTFVFTSSCSSNPSTVPAVDHITICSNDRLMSPTIRNSAGNPRRLTRTGKHTAENLYRANLPGLYGNVHDSLASTRPLPISLSARPRRAFMVRAINMNEVRRIFSCNVSSLGTRAARRVVKMSNVPYRNKKWLQSCSVLENYWRDTVDEVDYTARKHMKTLVSDVQKKSISSESQKESSAECSPPAENFDLLNDISVEEIKKEEERVEPQNGDITQSLLCQSEICNQSSFVCIDPQTCETVTENSIPRENHTNCVSESAPCEVQVEQTGRCVPVVETNKSDAVLTTGLEPSVNSDISDGGAVLVSTEPETSSGFDEFRLEELDRITAYKVSGSDCDKSGSPEVQDFSCSEIVSVVVEQDFHVPSKNDGDSVPSATEVLLAFESAVQKNTINIEEDQTGSGNFSACDDKADFLLPEVRSGGTSDNSALESISALCQKDANFDSEVHQLPNNENLSAPLHQSLTTENTSDLCVQTQGITTSEDVTTSLVNDANRSLSEMEAPGSVSLEGDSQNDGNCAFYSHDNRKNSENGCYTSSLNEKNIVEMNSCSENQNPGPPVDESMSSAETKVHEGPQKLPLSPSEGPFGHGDRRRLSISRFKRSSLQGSLRCKKSTEVAALVEEYFKDIFVPLESVKAQLVRQSRDILLCRYQGHFQQFRENFLVPVALLLTQLKSKNSEVVCLCGKRNICQQYDNCDSSSQSCSTCVGWPLCFNRRLVVNLGELDEALLKPGDFYVCVKESNNVHTELNLPNNPSILSLESSASTLTSSSTVPLETNCYIPESASASTSQQTSITPYLDCSRLANDTQTISPLLAISSSSNCTDSSSCLHPECSSSPSSDLGNSPPASVCLCIKYRQKNRGEAVRERRIHDLRSLFTTMDWMESSGSDVMISDDHLTTVLQHLLLSVERGIERLEWAGVSKPWPFLGGQTSSAARCCHGSVANTKDSSVQTNPEDEVTTNSTTTIVNSSCDDQHLSSEGSSPCCETKQNGGSVVNDGDDGVDNVITRSNLLSSVNIDVRRDSKPSPTEDVMLRLSSGSLAPADEDPDDGYCEHTLTQPTVISQVDGDLLHSEIALLPGCRDMAGRSIVIFSSSAMKDCPSVSACHLAQLLLYFHTIPKKEVVSRGFLALIDASEACEEVWNVLDEVFYLLEGNVPNAVGQVLVFLDESTDISALFPTSRIQCEVVNSSEKLQCFIRRDQLLTKYGGTYLYDHQEWISFRKFLEPFINGCRLSGRHLVTLLEELRGSRLPPSSALTHQMIEQQKKSFRLTFQDEQLRHLEEEGDTILQELESYGTRSPHNADYRENLDRTRVLYDELRKAMTKLSKLADKRLHRLEQCLQMRTFQEESSQVLSWLCRKGTESLEKHQTVANSLGAIKEQEEEFEKFYFLAMRQIERGNDLLEEVSMLGHEPSLPKIREESQTNSDDDSGVQELAVSLKQHLGSFSEKLEGTRERIEDTAKCYQLMDKSYEWALEAMRFVSQMGLSNTGSAEGIAQQIRCLQEYLDDHVPVSDDTFQEIMDLCEKLDNEKLSGQCKVAKQRCQETVELIQARLKTLQKVKQQMEVDSFRGPLWDQNDSAPTPRTSRSHSQPTNLWTPVSSITPYSMCLGHHRRRSDSNAVSPVPQSYGSPIGSYTSFPSSYYLTAKETHPLDTFIQEKEEQILQRGLITEDLTCQGPVTSISRGVLDSRVNHRENASSVSSTSSSSSSNSSRSATSVLRSSGRGTYCSNGSGGVNIKWSKRYSRKSQMWQLRDETLEKIKNEVREQNALLHVERLNSPQESSDSIHSSSEADISPSSENSCKVMSPTQSDPARGPVPVNTHLLTHTSPSDPPDTGRGNPELANDEGAKAKKTLMLIMKEMIQTERDYVKSLEYIIENYIPELLREDIPQALRGQRNAVFGNIEKIYEFHSQYFLNELEQYENAPFFAGQCFLKYEPQFYLYALYNKNKPKCDALMFEYGNAFFRKKQLELEDKMDLASYLLKPVQRMGKYALLLKQLLKECPEREPEHQDLKAAEEMVRFQLRHGNDLLAMDALRDCDVNVKEQGRLLRQDEFLVWQGRSRKSLRHVFLFEDLILFSKARRDPQKKGYEMYQYKHSIKTTDMGLTEQVGDSPSKFEIWFRKRKLNDTYVLQAPTPDVKAAWVHELSKLLWKQALRNREMRLAEMSSMGIGNKPCLDIKPSEDQINDRSISIHQLARAPRFRNSFGMPPYDQRITKRPHSIISVSSSSSSGSSQSSFTFYGTLNLGFEPGDSPRPLHRSLTQQSQCSTESGFCTDASTAGDSPGDSEQPRHKKAERSDSLLSSDSLSTSTTASELNCSPCEEQAIEECITTSM